MKIALLSPIAWRTPPRHYGPWENVVYLIAEGLVRKGIDVTLFATADSQSPGKLEAVCPRPYEEDESLDAKVWECLHISHLFENAHKYDLIHNNYDFLPLSYSRLVKTPMVTTIHGFSSPQIIPVYKKYNDSNFYISISNADRSSELDYLATVYHGIDLKSFTFKPGRGKYLLYFGRIHPDKGTREAIEIAKLFGMELIIAGIIQDQSYYQAEVAPFIDNQDVRYIGSVGPDARDKLLGEAYALLHPIYFPEPFGLSVVETMACGTPVIAFNRGSMAEVLAHGKTGYLVNSITEAVAKLKETSLIKRETCRTWVEEKFSQDRMVDDYIKLYQRIIDNPDKRELIS